MVELAGIIIIGIFAQWVAWRMKLPAILPLIIAGLLVGPISTFFTADGEKLIQPIFDGTSGLFPGESLFWFVSLSIGIVLFEGGLTLKLSEIKDVGPSVLRLISLGSLVTFIGAGIAAHFLAGLTWQVSFLFGALIIVTGPTVIAPILRNVRLNKNVAALLKWEGILIDPIGALAAVLVFDFIIAGAGHHTGFTSHAILSFLNIIAVGAAMGTGAAFGLYYLLKKEMLPHYLINVFTLAVVLAVFVLSDMIIHESGLLTVVVMGLVLGNLNVSQLKDILYFKESISVLLISILFILLAANIDVQDMELLMDWRFLVLYLIIILVLRPIGVFLSSRNSGLNVNEKIFISWVGPRGIVAAGIASLFGLKLVKEGFAGAEYITPLVFMVVLGTVLINASSARIIAGWLGVKLTKSDGILLIGAHPAARIIGKYIRDIGRHVVLVDSNESNIRTASEEGLEALIGDVYEDSFLEDLELRDIGYMLALTGSSDVNRYVCRKFRTEFGELGTYRLLSSNELKLPPNQINASGLFSQTDDYIRLLEVSRDNPKIHEVALKGEDHYSELLGKVNDNLHTIPLFIRHQDNSLSMVNVRGEEKALTGDSFVYIGEEIIEKTV